MPEEGISLTPKSHLLTWEEYMRLVKLFAEAGVDKVRLTGGEPTVRKDYIEMIRDLNQIEGTSFMWWLLGIRTIGMTTNGINLRWKVHEVKEAGLTNLNLSIDSLVPAKFDFITRWDNGLKAVLEVNFTSNLFSDYPHFGWGQV